MPVRVSTENLKEFEKTLNLDTINFSMDIAARFIDSCGQPVIVEWRDRKFRLSCEDITEYPEAVLELKRQRKEVEDKVKMLDEMIEDMRKREADQ